MRKAACGDPNAFGALIELCRADLIAAIASEFSLDRAEAEVRVQDALASAWSNREKFDWCSFEKFRAWLKVLATNSVIDEIRHATRQKRDVRREVRASPDVLNMAAPGDSPSRPARQRERAESLDAAIDALLTETEAAVIRLRFLKGKSVAETAETLGLSMGYVKNLTSGAIRKLEEVGSASDFISG